MLTTALEKTRPEVVRKIRGSLSIISVGDKNAQREKTKNITTTGRRGRIRSGRLRELEWSVVIDDLALIIVLDTEIVLRSAKLKIAKISKNRNRLAHTTLNLN